MIALYSMGIAKKKVRVLTCEAEPQKCQLEKGALRSLR